MFSIAVGGMTGGGIFAVLGLGLELAGGAAPLAFTLAGLASTGSAINAALYGTAGISYIVA